MKKNDITVLEEKDTVAHILKNRQMYIGTDELRAEKLVYFIVSDLLTLKVQDFSVRFCNGWWLIHSPEDWMLIENDLPIDRLFNRIIGLPNGKVHEFRSEVLLHAFGTDVTTIRNGITDVIKGSYPEEQRILQLIAEIPADNRILIMRL